MKCKRTIVALVSVFMCLMAVAEGRITLFHVYDWNESPTGVVTVTAADPFYYGGWTVDLEPAADDGFLTAQEGITMYQVPQPVWVDYRTNQARLDATSDEPFATVSGTSTMVSDGVTTRVDSVKRYYVVNEEWVTGGELSDIKGELLADGSIHFAGGFAYYIETVKTTTITERNGESRTFTDETDDVSRIFRDLWLLTPNGKHEFTNESTGETRVVDVYISQVEDTVKVVNLYGYGAPEIYMILNTDGTMSYPVQMLRDIPDSESQGTGVWYNATAEGGNITGGNTGQATAQAITWDRTVPWDRVTTWTGWIANKLYYSDGSLFDVPSEVTYEPGDVNHDGKVDVTDVTMLISYVLGNNPDGFFVEEANVDGDANGTIDVTDVTALISKVLS